LLQNHSIDSKKERNLKKQAQTNEHSAKKATPAAAWSEALQTWHVSRVSGWCAQRSGAAAQAPRSVEDVRLLCELLNAEPGPWVSTTVLSMLI